MAQPHLFQAHRRTVSGGTAMSPTRALSTHATNVRLPDRHGRGTLREQEQRLRCSLCPYLVASGISPSCSAGAQVNVRNISSSRYRASSSDLNQRMAGDMDIDCGVVPSARTMSSLTRKRSLVQSQYRPAGDLDPIWWTTCRSGVLTRQPATRAEPAKVARQKPLDECVGLASCSAYLWGFLPRASAY